MSEMNDIIKTSLEGIKAFANVDTVIGNPINTPNGVTIIPVSKVTVGFVGVGVDYGSKKIANNQNFGSGSGTGVSVTPLAFLTVNKDSSINLIPMSENSGSMDRVVTLIEHSPEIIERLKGILT